MACCSWFDKLTMSGLGLLIYARLNKVISGSFGHGFFRVEGHARSAPKGEDPVCAAVSALAQALLHGLVEVARIEVAIVRLASGSIDARWDETTATPEARAILRTFEDSFREIAARNEAHLRFERVSDDSGLSEGGSSV